MIFKRLNRTAAESVFAVFQANVSGLTADNVVGLEINASSVNGVAVNQPVTALEAAHAVVGVCDAAIANGAYGLVQIYGYRSTSKIFQTDTSQSQAVALIANSGLAYFSSKASTVGVVPFAILLETIASSAASATLSKKIFLRMM